MRPDLARVVRTRAQRSRLCIGGRNSAHGHPFRLRATALLSVVAGVHDGGDGRYLPGAANIGVARHRRPTTARSTGVGANDAGLSTDTTFVPSLAMVGLCAAG